MTTKELDTKAQLEKAIALASVAHMGQRDLVGEPYILHSLRVMLKMDDPESMIVAVLHDVIEDKRLTKEQLLEAGIGERMVNIVEMLTRGRNESYSVYIERLVPHGWARKVKLADLDDNLDPRRVHELYQSGLFSESSIVARVRRYLKAWSTLKEHE